jgi:WD repeat-containing protein 42A
MASQSSNEKLKEEKTYDENEQNSAEELNNEEHIIQRKRSRVGSHLDEESDTTVNIDKINETINETSSTSVENHEISEDKKTNDITGQIKRRKLNVDIEEIIDQDEKTNDSVQSIITTTTTNSESKDESSTTTTTTTTDEDDDETKNEDEDEEEEEEDDNTNEQINLPPTTNIYLRLRQRELGIFHRLKEHATCRAFHNNIIASRNLVQKMKVSHTLDGHNGCVNALAFNRTGNKTFSSFNFLLKYLFLGTLLASASDDLQIILWDWALNQAAVAYESDHHSNVFQVNFLFF